MSFYWIKTNAFIKKIFSNHVWAISNTENKIYLTFDDGPIPEITEWVLEELKKHNAKATFFCIGHNIEKHPEIFKKVINDAHSVGNHTFNHLNGWKTSTKEYLENFKLCEDSISNLQSKIYNLKSKLFRPPYGKIKFSQSKKLRKLGYKIIMWDVLSADYDTAISPEKCLENVLKNVSSGSIIVFHDSVKAFPNLEYTLPRALKYWQEKGFVFEKLD
ncbi:polysaccharide deacetylase family protein [Flavobacterium sp.]|uniref:polysaccharide deacetylase family protein n=1 Tax=Flavobacterium sp. TaxID=239 RepID=UPI0025C09570|nr:polysaccharide deacetylase family protein [Flavobacterium sp.]MBA4275641.1 polysaccharide deacetylase family protein [Flavobacterium sp.]